MITDQRPRDHILGHVIVEPFLEIQWMRPSCAYPTPVQVGGLLPVIAIAADGAYLVRLYHANGLRTFVNRSNVSVFRPINPEYLEDSK